MHALGEEDGLRASGNRQLRSSVHFLRHFFIPFLDPPNGIYERKGNVEEVNGLLKLQ